MFLWIIGNENDSTYNADCVGIIEKLLVWLCLELFVNIVCNHIGYKFHSGERNECFELIPWEVVVIVVVNLITVHGKAPEYHIQSEVNGTVFFSEKLTNPVVDAMLNHHLILVVITALYTAYIFILLLCYLFGELNLS